MAQQIMYYQPFTIVKHAFE